MGKLRNVLFGMLAGCFVFGMAAYADGGAAIAETYTGDTDFSVYVKNAGTVPDTVDVQIATAKADSVKVQPVSELDVPMRTLVLLDNSLSISSGDRERIAQLLQNLISDRLNGEEISIAVFGEEIQVLTDYTSDYGILKKTIDSIAYQDQETYLTDVLYGLLDGEYRQGAEDVYRRILIISDGVDNKSLGYTKEELYALLKEVRIPVYTIGCTNKKNNEELENMFALSRMTGVDYFPLEDITEILDITDYLNRDREILRLSVVPPEELMDGSRKMVKVMLPDGAALSAEITMPQQIFAKDTEAEPEPEPVAESEPAAEPEPAAETEPAAEEAVPRTGYLSFILTGGVAVLAAAVLIAAVILRKKRNREPEFEPLDDALLEDMQNSAGSTAAVTEILTASAGRDSGDGSTVMIWNPNTAYQIVLTDAHSPAKSYRVPLSGVVTIGRKAELCDIALDYDKSVSAKHCEISVRSGKFYARDLQSSNGTYLNGSRILSETEIFSGNILKFGRLEMRFEVR